MVDKPVKLEKTEARQGKSGLGVRYVLMGGTALVIIAFAIVWLVSK